MCGRGHAWQGVHGRGRHTWRGGAGMAGEMATPAAGGMHPTGMHSCFADILVSVSYSYMYMYF